MELYTVTANITILGESYQRDYYDIRAILRADSPDEAVNKMRELLTRQIRVVASNFGGVCLYELPPGNARVTIIDCKEF